MLGRSASSRPRNMATTRRLRMRCSTWRSARSESTVNVMWRATRGECAFLRSTFGRNATVRGRGKKIAQNSQDGSIRTPVRHAFQSASGGTSSPPETTVFGRSASSRPRNMATTRRPERRCSTWRSVRSETSRNGRGNRNDPDERASRTMKRKKVL